MKGKKKGTGSFRACPFHMGKRMVENDGEGNYTGII